MLKFASEIYDDNNSWVRFSFRLRENQLRQIKKRAREEDLTASAYVRRVLKKALEGQNFSHSG